MTQQEFFKDWWPYIDQQALNTALQYITKDGPFYPEASNVFRAFKLCSAKNTKAIFLGQDPYPQKDVATGVLFGNKADTPEDKLSPSLQLVKEAMVNYEVPHYGLRFDNSLEAIAKQGVLMLNSSLTVKPNIPGSHALYWRPFIAHFLEEFSARNGAIVYVLFGKQAQSFESYIFPITSHIIKTEHPAALARKGEKIPTSLFRNINSLIHSIHGNCIEWYRDNSTFEMPFDEEVCPF